MSDKEFITYLGMKLLNSGEDCCMICANCPPNEFCENAERDKPDRNFCIDGLRKFAEGEKR